NLLQTGAGSPAGITIYEGDLLPAAFHGQILHCDAGPSVCRAYPIEDDGAGYSASMISIMEGTRDNWFRPSDVSIAPDGSIFVADWYDPGVGGHQAGDIDSGRIFRVIPKGGKKQYETPTFDFDSAEGAVEALKNPNYCVRYLAWTALRRMGSRAESALLTLWKSKNPVYRARALWLLGKTKDRGDDYVQLAAGDADPNIRIVAVRLARQLKLDVIPLVRQLASDPNPQVRREAAIALRGCKSPDMPAAWTELAVRHDGQDRWYLEALGIAADGRWDECLETWLERVNHKWNTAAGRDIIWRSRAQQTSALLAQIIEGTDQNTEQLPRYFRAFDFQASDPSQQALFGLVSRPLGESTRDTLIASESVSRLKKLALADNENHRRALANALDASQGTEQFSRLVDRFEVVDRYPALLAVAQADPDSREGVAAMAVLLRKQQKDLIRSAVVDTDRVKGENTVKALGNVADAAIVELLSPVVTDDELALSIRRAAARAMARHREGADILLRWAGEKEMTAILQAAAVPLHAAPWPNVRDQADKLFPLPEVQGPPLPPIAQLVEKSGNVQRGQQVFASNGTCANCHVVNGQGKAVGPDLSEIGKKLSRQALFESILFPSAGISHNYEAFALETRRGTIVTGVVTSRTPEEVRMVDAEGIERAFRRSDIESLDQMKTSLMPADLQKTISADQLIDVVEYLATLKSQATDSSSP
ncbi:MAG TPA: HEAT repeat domain-containing protein, partial [Pirellulales bacterium]|nr:HEAT repeat domain-containing protein [Pirellulales bacterium]